MGRECLFEVSGLALIEATPGFPPPVLICTRVVPENLCSEHLAM